MRIVVIAAATLLIGATNCRLNVNEPSPVVIDATVRLVNVEGGCWVLETRSGRRYEAAGLPAEFREDGLEVTVELQRRPDLASLCQLGTMVEVLSIEAR